MSDTIFCPDDFVFGLDIGTRNVVGTVGYMKNGRFQAAAIVSKEHETRAMLDGQIHDIGKVGDTIRTIKHELESENRGSLQDMEKMQSVDLNYWLPGDILQKADKMSMAHSLEVRVQVLDKEVFNFAAKLPKEAKIEKGTNNYIFRKAV